MGSDRGLPNQLRRDLACSRARASTTGASRRLRGEATREAADTVHLLVSATEPWLFTFSADGRVAARLEGSFGNNAFREAVEAALRE
jgi:outer membrane translocation and assembly module TamA